MQKKVFHALLVATLCLVLVGCGTSGQPGGTAASTPTPTHSAPAPTESTPPSSPTPTPSALPERTDLNFRIAKWGDSKDIVKDYETAEPFESTNDNILVYIGTVAGLDAGISYFFDPEYGFYMGGYRLVEDHTTNASYISDYNTLKAAIAEKYGEPTSDDIKTLDTLAEYADAGQALQLGYVAYMTKWELDDCEIFLGMMGDNYEITTQLSYTVNDFTPAKNTDGV